MNDWFREKLKQAQEESAEKARESFNNMKEKIKEKILEYTWSWYFICIATFICGVIITISFIWTFGFFNNPSTTLIKIMEENSKNISKKLFDSDSKAASNRRLELIRNPELYGISLVKYKKTSMIVMMSSDKRLGNPELEAVTVIINYLANDYDCIVSGTIYKSLRGEVHFAGFDKRNPTDLDYITELLKLKGVRKAYFLGNNPDNVSLPFPFVSQIYGNLNFKRTVHRTLFAKDGYDMEISDDRSFHVDIYFPAEGIPYIK